MIPIIELSGTYHEMGLQYGKHFKSKIVDFAKTRMTRLISFVKKYGKVDVTESEVLEIAESLLPVHEQYDVNIWEEFCAIAQGADISLAWLLVAMGYTDLRDYICKVKGFNDLEVRFEGCTGFILDKTMSIDNKMIIGQTWDMSVEAMDYLVIVKKNPVNGPRVLYLTTMGAVALIGLNSNNLAVGTTNLMANDCDHGVNYLFTISKALMANDYASMLDGIISTKRMSGHSFLCAGNNSGDLIESCATHYIDYKIDHYPLVITNNYSEAMRQYELVVPEQRRRNSIFRYGRATSLLAEQAKWSHMDLWQLLADEYRSRSGGAICNEDYSSKYSEFATLATALLIPEQQTMWVCKGGAANGKLQKVTL